MHAVDMQIHADWKGNVAQDYIMLWAITVVRMYEVSRKYHFTFSFDSALCKWE